MIHSLKKAWPVSLMCRLLKVPRSSYYAFRGRPVKAPASPALLKAMRQIHIESRSSYGSRRMAQALQQQGHAIGRYRARTLMREAQLAVARRRTHRYRKGEGEALVAPNLLERRFDPGAINRVWAGDITYVRTRQGWSYLAVVMDLHSRRIVGWAFATQADTELVMQALHQARHSRRPAAGLMFHSDQGCPVHQRALCERTQGKRDRSEHEQKGKLLGQRGGRALLQEPEERMDWRAGLC